MDRGHSLISLLGEMLAEVSSMEVLDKRVSYSSCLISCSSFNLVRLDSISVEIFS